MATSSLKTVLPFCTTLLLLAGSGAAAAEAAAEAGKPVRVILVGDSTMATRSGYGDALCQRFRPEVSCINLARGGRSSGSFRAEGRWDEVLKLLRDDMPGAGNAGPGHTEKIAVKPNSITYVLIQFGHNDQPGKPGRSTDLVTQFPANLERYVGEAAALGAIPVLVTPLTRRSFRGPYLRDDLAPWAAAARQVAADKHVALLDLNRLSADAVQAMGSAEADTLAQEPPPPVPVTPAPVSVAATGAVTSTATSTASATATEPQGAPKSAFDRTHVGAKGAALFSGMVATELRRLFPALKAHFKPDT